MPSLALRTIVGAPDSPTVKQVQGKTYHFPGNDQKIDWLRLVGTQLVLKTDSGEQKLLFHATRWTTGTAALGRYPSKKVLTRGVWPTPDTLALTVCAYETPYVHTLTCEFVGESVTLVIQTNVGFGPTVAAPIVGRAT